MGFHIAGTVHLQENHEWTPLGGLAKYVHKFVFSFLEKLQSIRTELLDFLLMNLSQAHTILLF